MLRSSQAAPRSHPLQLLTWEAGDQMKVSLPQKNWKYQKLVSNETEAPHSLQFLCNQYIWKCWRCSHMFTLWTLLTLIVYCNRILKKVDLLPKFPLQLYQMSPPLLWGKMQEAGNLMRLSITKNDLHIFTLRPISPYCSQCSDDIFCSLVSELLSWPSLADDTMTLAHQQ